MANGPTRRVRVTMTRTMWVDVPADEADAVLPYEHNGKKHLPDITDLSERVTRWQRIAAYGHEHIEGDLTVEEADPNEPDPWYAKPVDATERERYLWSARHFLIEARHQLTCARYRDGNCPEVDDLNGRLARLEDELRLMALEGDGVDWPEVKAWRQARSA